MNTDPFVGRARRVAAAYAAICAAMGALAILRPEILRRVFGYGEGADDLYARWGYQLLGYTAVFGLAAARPGSGPLAGAATLSAVEVPADLSVTWRVAGPRRLWHPLAAASNVATTVLFGLAAVRVARRASG